MVAFNFSPEFVGPVERREKRRTIRRTCRAKPGDRIQLYTGLRTKNCRKLSEVDPVCTMVTEVAIQRDNLLLGNLICAPDDRDQFARRDGFEDYDAMYRWFSQRYGSDQFSGFLHLWDWSE